jgi:hypothetical protein
MLFGGLTYPAGISYPPYVGGKQITPPDLRVSRARRLARRMPRPKLDLGWPPRVSFRESRARQERTALKDLYLDLSRALVLYDVTTNEDPQKAAGSARDIAVSTTEARKALPPGSPLDDDLERLLDAANGFRSAVQHTQIPDRAFWKALYEFRCGVYQAVADAQSRQHVPAGRKLLDKIEPGHPDGPLGAQLGAIYIAPRNPPVPGPEEERP